jgi:uncharacterized membrane protein
MLGLLTLYYTWRTTPAGNTKDSLNMALVCGTIYWLAGLAAILFPEADGVDPEFGGPGFPQAKIFTALMGLGVAGWAYERSSL